ncbi:MAG TPA: hypothetical protein VGR14_02885 [Verrucomicrobiae bacterium]|jgi:hypothetical protein|nr:hypothetical protein [Verrucomicrobiae bacterium]
MSSHEPSPSQLERLRESVTVTLVGFDRTLARLYPDDLLRRYNRVEVELHNRSDNSITMLFVTVHRDGSKIGADNFYTVPLHVPELAAHRACRYEFLSFDSFNEPFERIRASLTTPQEYAKRRLAKKYLERAPDLIKFVSYVDVG